MFNDAFDRDESPIIVKFIENMIQGFTNGKDRIYLLRILNMIVDYYNPLNPRNKHYQLKTRTRLSKL